MSGRTRNDKFWNNCIQEKVGVIPLEQKMIETQMVVWACTKKIIRGFSEKN